MPAAARQPNRLLLGRLNENDAAVLHERFVVRRVNFDFERRIGARDHPAVLKGDWALDATVIDAHGAPPLDRPDLLESTKTAAGVLAIEPDGSNKFMQVLLASSYAAGAATAMIDFGMPIARSARIRECGNSH